MPPGTPRSRSFILFTMRVSLLHLGHEVDFVVSMTFFRSAVFAIFAIQSLLTGMSRQPKGSGIYLVMGEYCFREYQNAGPSPIGPARSTRAERMHCTRQ